MLDILLSLFLVTAGGLIATGAAYLLVERNFFLPQLVQVAEAFGAPKKLVVLAAFALFIAFAFLLIIAGLIGLPSLAWNAMIEWFARPIGLIPLVSRFNTAATAVAVLLGIMSVWSIGVAVNRIYALSRVRSQLTVYAPQLMTYLKEGRLAEATELSRSWTRHSRVARGLLAILIEYQSHADSGWPNQKQLEEKIHEWLAHSVALTRSDLNRGVNTLAAIGSTAPFIGLLGSVVGILNTFIRLASSDSGGIGAVSAGIAEALTETALGLFVAIPAIWFYNVLTTRIEHFNVGLDNFSADVVDYFIKRTA